MEEKYQEDKISKSFCRMNQEYLVFKQDPDRIVPQNILEKLWVYLLRMAKLYNRKILNSRLYDDLSKRKKYRLDGRYKVCGAIPKIVVYTCILGKYDDLCEPLYWNDHYEFYAITDFEIPSSSKWNRIDINQLKIPKKLGVIRMARYVKTHPHTIFPMFDVSIWVDGNIMLVADMVPIVLNMNDKEFLGVHLHPNRRRLDTEVRAIFSLKRNADRNSLLNQVKWYKKDGYKDNVDLLETTILVRKHNDDSCMCLMEKWWDEILMFSTRDQISLPYILWKSNMSLENICILGDNVKLNSRFRYMNHKF